MRLAMKLRVAELKVAEAEQAVAEQTAVIARIEAAGDNAASAQAALLAREGQLATLRTGYAQLLQSMHRLFVG